MQTRNLAVILFLISTTSFSQEMFINGGFEQYSSCPTGSNQTLKIIGCTGKNDTPEYYNCSYGASRASTGSGCVYLGSISNGVNSFVQEGINLKLTTPLTVGTEYRVSLSVKYGVTVFGDASFDYTEPLSCFNLRFLFSNGNQSGRPIIYHNELDGGVLYENSNNSYHKYTFTFTPSENYSHLYIITVAADDNKPNSPNADCMSAGFKAYVYYHYIDDLSIQSTGTLPIELISFSAIEDDQGVRLDWQTASEINNDMFSVERSIDGINWKEIKQVTGSGNSSTIISYQTFDFNPLNGISYYRLKQTDFDGKYSYSQIETVFIKKTPNFLISPNPNNGHFNIILGDEFNVELSILNTQGQNVYNNLNASGDIEIDLSDQPSGLYLIKAVLGENVVVERVIKQ